MRKIKQFFSFLYAALWDLIEQDHEYQIWIDEAAHIPQEAIDSMLAAQQPDPLHVPGLDAGIPTSG